LLVFGWGDSRRERGLDPLAVYLLSEADLRSLWHQNREALTVEAAALGMPQPWAARYFDEEP
jgi:hypothetical protein